jgi:hypothetical protein
LMPFRLLYPKKLIDMRKTGEMDCLYRRCECCDCWKHTINGYTTSSNSASRSPRLHHRRQRAGHRQRRHRRHRRRCRSSTRFLLTSRMTHRPPHR